MTSMACFEHTFICAMWSMLYARFCRLDSGSSLFVLCFAHVSFTHVECLCMFYMRFCKSLYRCRVFQRAPNTGTSVNSKRLLLLVHYYYLSFIDFPYFLNTDFVNPSCRFHRIWSQLFTRVFTSIFNRNFIFTRTCTSCMINSTLNILDKWPGPTFS